MISGFLFKHDFYMILAEKPKRLWKASAPHFVTKSYKKKHQNEKTKHRNENTHRNEKMIQNETEQDTILPKRKNKTPKRKMIQNASASHL